MAKRQSRSQLDKALSYAKRGFAVLPLHSVVDGRCTCKRGSGCPSPGKHPLTSNGVGGASKDPKIIKGWFLKRPTANIGIATGKKSGLVVLDIDPRNGGNETLQRTEKELGHLPKTVEASTGGGGRHLLFVHPVFKVRKDSAAKIFGSGVDILGAHSYFVAPASLHISGKNYRWPKGKGFQSRKLKPLPKAWRHKLRRIKSNATSYARPGDVAPVLEGQRNNHLTTIAGQLRRFGSSREVLLAALEAENSSRCKPPLDNEELQGIATNVANYVSGAIEGDQAENIAGSVLQHHFVGGKHLIFASDGLFWYYTGTHWTETPKGWLEGRILDTIKATRARGNTSTASLIAQTLALLRAQQAVAGDPLRFLGESPPLINCLNGELTIDSEGYAELHPHRAESFLRHCHQVNFDPEVTCPNYDRALRGIFADAPDVKAMCRHWNELSGYILFPRRNIPLITILMGSGNNGKTSLVETITQLLGRAQVFASRVEDLESNRFTTGNLLGKLMFIDDDVKAGARLPDGPLKKLSEAKTMTGEKKFGPTFEFTCMAIPLLLCNNSLSLADVSHGMLRRLKVIPFDHQFTDETADKNLFIDIRQNELSGVLNRALEGLQRVIQRGCRFKDPDSVCNATAAWLKQSNPLPAFLDDCCEIRTDFTCYVAELYSRYVKWAGDSGFTMQQQRMAFQRNLAHLGYHKINPGNRGARVGGLRLRKNISD